MNEASARDHAGASKSHNENAVGIARYRDGILEMEMKASGFLDTGCDLKNPDFALMAEAMGVRGIRVEKPQELKGAIMAALAHKGPVLVDVMSARQELAMPPRTTPDQAYHFGMFMMKAVLDGRGTKLVDLAKVNLIR